MIRAIARQGYRAAANLRSGRHWSDVSTTQQPTRIRWWESPTIVGHVNNIICGKPLDIVGAATVEAVRQAYPGRVFGRAVSIGCGHGAREMMFVTAGMVDEFHLFELSPVRSAAARDKARNLGIASKVVVHNSDGLKHRAVGQYDLVHWSGSLHHMHDANEAVRWSHRALASGGVFVMDDFIGPTRMQWSDRMLNMANRVRAALPETYMRDPRRRDDTLPRRVGRPARWRVYLSDPTECADSASIIPSLREVFPGIAITPTGGAIYHLALNDILHNIEEVEDRAVLNQLLRIDDLCTKRGEFHYAFAIAEKD